MEDNYYKKGGSSSSKHNPTADTTNSKRPVSTTSPKVAGSSQPQTNGSNKNQHRARTQLQSRHGGSHHTLKSNTGSSSYHNHQDLGKGRIVESSSQSGFAIQHLQQQQLKQHNHHAQSQSQGEQVVKQKQQSNQHAQQHATEHVKKQVRPATEDLLSANSNNQRRAGAHTGARNSHEHFATLNQTPQPVIQVGISSSSGGGGGSSTPLTHMIQRRQFQMTQLPKSNSAVCKVSGGITNQRADVSGNVLSMHLQNPKITSQPSGFQKSVGESSCKKLGGTAHTLPADMHLDKNMSTLSGGHLNAHTRKGSAQITGKPTLNKPQGGVFQSGPDKMKTVSPANILTNNFMGLTPNVAVAESPQFVLSSNDKINFASKIDFASGLGVKSELVPPDQLKNTIMEHQGRESQSNGANGNIIQTSSAGQTKNFNKTGGITTLSLQQQHSCGAIVSHSASHFNTPSNCYQAQNQQQIFQPASAATPNNIDSGSKANSIYNQARQRSSLPTGTKEPMVNVLTTTESQVHHLSQNSYEMTAPLHISTSYTPAGITNRQASNASLIGGLHQHSNSTLIANLVQGQNTSAQNLPQHQTTVNNNSQGVNFTQHTQQAHPNLQAAMPQHHQMTSNGWQKGHQPGGSLNNAPAAAWQAQNTQQNNGHLSASQFDISALLRQQTSVNANQHVLDFQELCSNTTHHAGHQTQGALKMSVEASTRDIDFLRQRFYAEYGCDTNDIFTLYSYWQSNFQSFVQPGCAGNNTNGNQTTAINALQIANMSSYRQNPAHHHTITGPSGGNKSSNVTAFGIIGKSRHTTINQHQTINFNSQSFDNQTMTTSHIQPRTLNKFLEIQHTAQSSNAQGGIMQTVQPLKEGALGAGQDSTEIQHFTTGSVGGQAYTPFDVNQQMFFVAQNMGAQSSNDLQHIKGRRTQPCIRHNSTVSNRQNCTDTVSFHRDVPTPMMQREDQLASIEAEDEKHEFSFEEPAIDGTNEHSIEEEEKSLINALSFKKQIVPLADGQNLHEIENQRGWATTKQESNPGLPRQRHPQRPLSKDQCGFTIQLSPINRFAPSPRSKRSVFDFYALRNSMRSMLSRGIMSAKKRIKKRGSTNKDGARKFLHKQLQVQAKTLSVLTRCDVNQTQVVVEQESRQQQSQLTSIYRLKTALDVIFLQGGTKLAQLDTFKRLLPKNNRRDFDSNENKTTLTQDDNQRNQSDFKRRRDKSMKARGTSKSRKRQGSRNSRKQQRMASLYRESTSSIGEESANIPMFTHLGKDSQANQGDLINVKRPQPVSEVVQDAETTQDIQKLCKEIEDAEKHFTAKLTQDEDQFDKQVTRQVFQAERALQESKRESQTRELSMRGTRRESNKLSLADRANFKAQSMSSLDQAMQTPLGIANATQRHPNPSELYGTKTMGNNLAQYAQTNDPEAPNTERPNAQSIELRLAMHHQTQNQKKTRGQLPEERDSEADETRPMIRAQQPKTQSKGKRLNVVSLLDQKSEPCLLKPKKLALDKQQVKLFAGKTQSAQKELEMNASGGEALDLNIMNKTPNDRKTNTGAIQSQTALQTTNSRKHKLTFIKTKNINFNSLSKLSGRMQPSATSTHQAAPGLRIKLQKTGGDSTDRSGAEMRFAAQTTCQSALATHKHTGTDLRTHLNLTDNKKAILKNAANQYHQDNNTVPNNDDSSVTPDKPTQKVKYASARIKLLRVDQSQDSAQQVMTCANGLKTNTKGKVINKGLEGDQHATGTSNMMEPSSPTSSCNSTLGGFKHIRRLVEMLINEFYRKRNKSIKIVSREKQVDTLVEFWWQSLSQQKILCKLKGKLAKTGLVEKEKHLMNFLNGTDPSSLFQLQKHSTTRKYGELAVVQEQVLRKALADYLTKSQ